MKFKIGDRVQVAHCEIECLQGRLGVIKNIAYRLPTEEEHDPHKVVIYIAGLGNRNFCDWELEKV